MIGDEDALPVPAWAREMAEREAPPPQARHEINARQWAELTGRTVDRARDDLNKRVKAGKMRKRDAMIETEDGPRAGFVYWLAGDGPPEPAFIVHRIRGVDPDSSVSIRSGI